MSEQRLRASPLGLDISAISASSARWVCGGCTTVKGQGLDVLQNIWRRWGVEGPFGAELGCLVRPGILKYKL